MGRGDDIRQILNLAKNMRDSHLGYSIQMIEEECGVSRRTAMRIKDIITDIFETEEVFNPTSRVKKWRLRKGTLDRLTAFTVDEVATLENCQNYLKNQNCTNGFDLLPEIIKKIKIITSSSAVQNDVDALLELQGYAVHQAPKIKLDKEVLEKISYAMLAQKYLTFSYKNKKGEEKIRTVAPYAIIYSEYTYLVAKGEEDQYPKHFLLYKMKDVRVIDEYFEKDEDFDLKEHLAKSFGAYQDLEPMNVKLLFSKEVREVVENYSFHPNQKMTLNSDGTTTVEFSAGGAFEICWFLFRWGKNVKIIAPTELKNTYKMLLKEALGQIK